MGIGLENDGRIGDFAYSASTKWQLAVRKANLISGEIIQFSVACSACGV